MSDHLPVLQVIIPLLAAPLCLLLRRRPLPWLVALLASAATLFIAVLLLYRVLEGGGISYHLGDWQPPWGIEYRIDAVNAYVLLLVALIGLVVLLYAPASVAYEIDAPRHYLFYAAYLLCLTGLLGIAITGDVFNVFVFLEISSLSSYALISLGRNRRALLAAYRYLIMGTIGASFFLIGIGLLYMATGTLNMADLAQRLDGLESSRTVLTAFAFLTVGLCIKAAFFPLHSWLPNAYTYAPSVVTAFLAATATKVSIYLCLRFIFTLFGAEYVFGALGLDTIIVALALAAVFVASLVAVYQTDLKRLLAYSSVAQIGYMMLGLGLASLDGLTGGIVHLFNHGLTKGALFLVLGAVFLRLNSLELTDLRGLGRRMPVTMFGFVVGGLGLIGVPLTAGFISKWYIVLAALERGWWPVAALVLMGSLIAVVYVWRVVETAYFEAPPKDAPPVKEAPLSMLVPMWLLLGASVYFGVFTKLSVGAARQAAAALLGVSP
ncbi:MAG: monovalent cation/H+ antiporter subunit D family protein [Candidatus Latescibacteria bacterium]|nr:monovalent cation/H+ antiporter subunit D family protein [Candidatus Latescibacterota bacterium]